ncbi:ferrochelatase [Magnetospirillum sulfuroxidans]|uniref:Ferrochelatase n=1 Tax=Magnetospirillum sulfuroxidans TaxID=611300 RepID=A0ABS5IIN1_9PROT|nr:ferrochelatase [Magnetospirillum sulfuroxidans]MBR9973628.1 ferrochelatase [Magnetospirillum sulfuroxidans]
MTKSAVILFNLGGPDSLDAVKPFLFNLFNDKAIIGAPQPIRWLLAKYISGKRAPIARDIYGQLGGKSPLLEQTEDQAKALQDLLGKDFKVIVAMRYWHPFAAQALAEAKQWGAQRVILLPLYPQFSTTTSGSSLKQWHQLAGASFEESLTVCCYPVQPGLIRAMAENLRREWDKAIAFGTPRLLFSAHGLPQSIIDKGDPYQLQVEQTAKAVVDELGIAQLDWAICYQSRVGPAKWIGPSTEAELERASRDNVPVVVTPVAFVSEHSETLVELDIEYRHVAEKLGIPAYFRAPAVSSHPEFIKGLAELVADPTALRGKACGKICCQAEGI